MNRILISGLVNLETTLLTEGFPVNYCPVRYPFGGVNTAVSGVGFNVASAMTALGRPVNFLSAIGDDTPGSIARRDLVALGVEDTHVLNLADATPQSVILYDSWGRRQVNVDLKDVQEVEYPRERFREAAKDCSMAVLCNINFSRPLLFEARRRGMVVATDVHAISSLEDEYNGDFMASANILFMSDELIPCPPEEWIRQVGERFGNDIIVIGMGEKGSLMYVGKQHRIHHQPAVQTRRVVNTVGAGDALFSAFIHFYESRGDAFSALKMASYFASYKVGEKGASSGFLSESQLLGLIRDSESHPRP